MTVTQIAQDYDFNPRSREGSDCSDSRCMYLQRFISIRAPARGATDAGKFSGMNNLNFNPRSREGSDTIDVSGLKPDDEFQSALPRGERPASTEII